MMHKLFILTLTAAMIAAGGCTTKKSLERKAPASRGKEVRSRNNREPASTGDPLFDTLFKKSRKEADEGGFSSMELTDRERALYNQNRAMRASEDPVVQSLRDKGRESKKERKQWVTW